MKKLCLVVSCLLWFVAKASAVMVGPFPGLDKMLERSDVVVVVRVEPFPVGTNGYFAQGRFDGWGLYECLVMRVLKGTVPEKRNLKLSLCGFITDWPYDFTIGTTYIVFLNKESSGFSDYRAPAIYGAVMRVSPFNHEKEPKGDTVLEKVANVIREGRDYHKRLRDEEQTLFSAALGEPLPPLNFPVRLVVPPSPTIKSTPKR